MKKQLRPYQKQGYDDIFKAFETNDVIMFVLATGGGKTFTFTEIIRHFYNAGKRAMLIAHREELINQAWQTIAAERMIAGIIKADYPNRYELPIQVCSIQTLARRKALPQADIIVIDEGHHVTEDNTYGRILAQYPNAKILIVTATPYRLSGEGFGEIVSGKKTKLIINSTLKHLIAEGWLVPLKYCVGSIPDMSGVPIIRGEYKEEEAKKIMELAPLVKSYEDLTPGMQGICYCINVEHSIEVAEQYNAAGIPAIHVDANTPDEIRKDAWDKFRAGLIKVVCNVGILTEGADFPSCEFVQLARPTKSLSMYLQMVGRVSRTVAGLVDGYETVEGRRTAIQCSRKPAGVVLDNAGCWLEHGFPDDEINWEYYFGGWFKKKQPEENPNIIEIPVFEYIDPATGQSHMTKKIKELAGMILVEITYEQKQVLRGAIEISEFEKIYRYALNNPEKFKKPGFFAYYRIADFCKQKNITMSPDLWLHLKRRLVDNINKEVDEYLKAMQLAGNIVIPSLNKGVAEIRAKGVHSIFLSSEREAYNKRKSMEKLVQIN